jgi:alkylation response protein AidB-like acyl-CoA dehydrogenase
MEKNQDKETKMILETLSKFSKDILAPQAAETDSHEIYPRESWNKLAELGFAGLIVDPEYEGFGYDYQTLSAVTEEMAKGCISMTGVYLVHNTVIHYISASGNQEQKKRYLPDLANGRRIGAMCITEPDAGSDVSNLSCNYRPDGDNYLINGEKIFITSGGEADIYIVLARAADTEGSKSLSTFIVEKDCAGISFGKKEKKMGYGGSSTNQVVLKNCVVAKENRLGKEGGGFKIMMKGLDHGRISVGAMAVGLAQVAFEEAVDYAASRKQFKQTISNFQGVQWMFSDMAIKIEASRLLVQQAALLCDQKRPFTKEAAMAKCFASDTAMEVTTNAVQIFGGYGYTKEYPVERHMREAKFMQIVEGTNQIQRNIIAREIFKHQKKK